MLTNSTRSQVAGRRAIAALVAAAGLVLAAGATTASGGPKPGFPAGTWNGKGTLATPAETVADLTTRTSGRFTFRLQVSKSGEVSGTGKWTIVQVGTGSIASKITSVANATFSGTPTNIRFAGMQTMHMVFVGYGKIRTEHTKTLEFKGGLAITKAGSCKVAGGHTNGSVTVKWSALLAGVTCVGA
jgi:hypothetical protein